MILCKLTDKNIQTHNGLQWVPGEWAPKLSGEGGLCSNTIYHCYEHPLLAALLNPIHAGIENPRLWLIEVEGEPITDHGLKRGYRSMRLTEEIPLPEISTEQRIKFAIHCALAGYTDTGFEQWANDWLSNIDRTAEAARAARAATWAARAATWAVEAARAATWAAEAATWAATWAAEAVTWAATWVAEAAEVDLIALAERAMQQPTTPNN